MAKEYRPWDLTETVESQTFDELNAACLTGWVVAGDAFDVEMRGFGKRRFLVLEREIPEPAARPLEDAELMGKLGQAMTLIERLARSLSSLHSVLVTPCSACERRAEGSFCAMCSSCIERAEDNFANARKLFPGIPDLDHIERGS